MTNRLLGTLDAQLTRNSHAQVVDGLGAAIIQGRQPAGSTLPRDEDLALRFGVSRTVLREAVKTLTAKGLLVARSRVGTKVRPRDDWNMFDADVLRWHIEGGTGRTFLADLSEMRLAIEPFAAGLAARRADEGAVSAMRRTVAAMADAPDRRSFALADFDLHRQITRASGNAFMQSVTALIEAALLSSFWISSPAQAPLTQAEVAADHGRIVEAIAIRDAPAAEEAMRHVIMVGRDRIVRAL
ncbi:FadR/GntR family transcriptional regulator [Rubellimicrobium aerolatum]|uniref:FadR/GntR family transcriptional regulator n=1 Tax=Rubellimicrobium aerolatum TaxID=490979 RepID=A0ABW0S808_9RHOB|nr:FadR/GntR family transcriptional regulator [Rubellimicrobium aerolatum]MBP1804401.1 DNA-binding FadR family transcriptional regulator [Rubellimicrobium aerolatum]